MKKELPSPKNYDLKSVILSHGWSGLAPFNVVNPTTIRFGLHLSGKPVDVTLAAHGAKVFIEANLITKEMQSAVAYMFRMEDDMQGFYSHAKKENRAWIEKNNMGRMLRAQTIFEDVVKMVLTTNCSWAFTKKMVNTLMETLGEKTPQGLGLFPLPEKFASKSEAFYRDKIRSGYRSPHLPKIGKLFSKGLIDTQSWLDPQKPTERIRKEILSIPGAGPYVADNILKLLGRFDYLGIDSWVRKRLTELWNKKKPVTDAQIEKAYQSHHRYQGMILWCDVTKDWLVGG